MKKKHAYLIIAHSQLELLQRLISALDDPRNDLYVHIDKKTLSSSPEFKTDYSALYILPKPVDACWGDVSLVKAELLLIEQMLKHGKYQYCHILSDSDFPIKSQDYIHAYCDNNEGKEFIGFAHGENVAMEIAHKAHYYHAFARHFKDGNVFQRGWRHLFLCLQHLLRMKRNRDVVFKKGCQWCSITYSFAQYLYDRKEEILKLFEHTCCPDELFIQTFCWNSAYKNNVYNTHHEFDGCLRFIKWENNLILPILETDVERMICSNRWFARKFSEDQMNLIDEISSKIN